MNRVIYFFLTSILAVLTLIATSANVTAQQAREQDAHATAIDAYIYLYPLVTMDVTRLQLTNVPEEKAKGPQGPVNEFHHFRAFPDEHGKVLQPADVLALQPRLSLLAVIRIRLSIVDE